MQSFTDIKSSDIPKETYNKQEHVNQKTLDKALQSLDSLLDDTPELPKYDKTELTSDNVHAKENVDSPEQTESTHHEGNNSLMEMMMDKAVDLLNDMLDEFTESNVCEKSDLAESESDSQEEKTDSVENDDKSVEEVKDNPRQEVVDGKTYYYDDNGNLYRVDNKLTPSTKYEVNGYKYETDDQGRIISASGKLRLRDANYNRKMEKVQDYEGQDYQEGDDRGHLIGHQFGGSDRLENLVPQDAKINQNDFRNFECELAKQVKEGKDVEVLIEPIYEGDSNRPVAIVVTYSIDGEENVRIFPNSQEG